MKKLTFFIFLTIFLGTQASLSAQSYVFKVMASSGNAAKAYPSVKGTNLVVGNTLQSPDQITVPEKSYLSLMHSSGGTVQIAKGGTYSVSDLVNKLNASTQSAGQKLANYVIGELGKNDEKNMDKYPHKYQNVTGSVERATFESELVVMLSKEDGKTQILRKSYLITWHHLKDTKNYALSVFNEFNEKVIEVSLPDTSYTIDFASDKFAELDFFLIKLSSKERPDIDHDEKYSLTVAEQSTVSAVEKALNTIRSSEAPAILKKLEEATLFESNQMLLDAQKAYQELVELDPSNEASVIAYNQFLVRTKIGKHKEIANAEKTKSRSVER